MPSVTFTNENLQQDGPVLEVHFGISSKLEEKYKQENKQIPEPVVIKALIDTGASSFSLLIIYRFDLPNEIVKKYYELYQVINHTSHKSIEKDLYTNKD